MKNLHIHFFPCSVFWYRYSIIISNYRFYFSSPLL